jgi:hypothetical protein
MADEKESKNPLTRFDKSLAEAKNVKDLFGIPDVRERYIKNFEAVTRRKDGANRMEQERFAYMELLNEKPDLKLAPNWAHFSALLKSATTGLSFRDGKLYVQPRKDREGNIIGLKVDPSPAGRREMMEMMPTVKKVPQAQVVMKGDIFVYDKLNEKILEHKSTEKTAVEDKLDNIVAAYQRIIWQDGTVSDVVVYHHDLVRAKAKSKVKNPDQDGVWQWNSEACKKVSTNRAFRLYHKYPDGVVLFDRDEEVTEDVEYEVQNVEVASEPEFNPSVNEETGEEYSQPEKPETTKKKKTKPKEEEEPFI